MEASLFSQDDESDISTSEITEPTIHRVGAETASQKCTNPDEAEIFWAGNSRLELLDEQTRLAVLQHPIFCQFCFEKSLLGCTAIFQEYLAAKASKQT
jgi:hypothetical protein